MNYEELLKVTHENSRQAGIAEERERIIKLLNIWDCNNDRCDCDSIDDCVYRQQLIALIKERQK